MTEEHSPRISTADRFSVTLIPRVHADMCDLRVWTGLNKTDVVNRAVSAYHFLESEARAGKEILVVSPDGKVQSVKFL